MERKTKRLIFLNAPYVLLGLFATKLGVVWRIAQGADFSEKMLHISEAFDTAFRSPFPSFYPADVLIGLPMSNDRVRE